MRRIKEYQLLLFYWTNLKLEVIYNFAFVKDNKFKVRHVTQKKDHIHSEYQIITLGFILRIIMKAKSVLKMYMCELV